MGAVLLWLVGRRTVSDYILNFCAGTALLALAVCALGTGVVVIMRTVRSGRGFVRSLAICLAAVLVIVAQVLCFVLVFGLVLLCTRGITAEMLS